MRVFPLRDSCCNCLLIHSRTCLSPAPVAGTQARWTINGARGTDTSMNHSVATGYHYSKREKRQNIPIRHFGWSSTISPRYQIAPVGNITLVLFLTSHRLHGNRPTSTTSHFFTPLPSPYVRKPRASVSRYLLSVTLSSYCPPNIIRLDAALFVCGSVSSMLVARSCDAYHENIS
jgi:hypothetical protein